MQPAHGNMADATLDRLAAVLRETSGHRNTACQFVAHIMVIMAVLAIFHFAYHAGCPGMTIIQHTLSSFHYMTVFLQPLYLWHGVLGTTTRWLTSQRVSPEKCLRNVFWATGSLLKV